MKIKNIKGHKINVNGQPLEVNSEMKIEKSQEVKNLIKGGYLEEIKDDK